MKHYEIHYTIDGVKRWWKTSARSEAHAKSKLYAKHSDRFVLVDWVEKV